MSPLQILSSWFLALCFLGLAPLTSTALLSQEEPAEDAEEAPPADAEVGDDAGDSPAPEADADAANPVAGQYWIIELDHQALRMISPQQGLGAGSVYWYMLYTLTNTSSEDREIYVQITAKSDHDRSYSDLLLPSVEKAIERKENQVLWGKSDEFELSRKRKPSDPKYNYFSIKAGEKKRCVAVFNRLDPNANDLVVRVAGLSNEIRGVAQDDGSRQLEERIRELRFRRPGDEHEMTLDSFKLVGKEWVKQQTAAARPVTVDKAAVEVK